MLGIRSTFLHPTPNDFDLVRRKLVAAFFGGHFAGRDLFNDQALFRMPRLDGRFALLANLGRLLTNVQA